MTLDPSSSEATAALQLAYQRLLALERFKSGFLARTSHEMRSPVNTIVSLHQLILEDLCEGPEEEKEFIAQSKDAALKMLALFDRVTAVSKLDVGREPAKLEKVDLSFLLPEVDMLTALQAANQNVRYEVSSPAEECEIITDEKWLKNILTSLIQDAIAHTKIMTLTVEVSESAISLLLDCDGDASQEDRTATGLQAQLEAVADMSELTEQAVGALKPAPMASNIQLSTGLVLAMAHTALPLINGSFAIAPASNAPERTQLKLTFLPSSAS